MKNCFGILMATLMLAIMFTGCKKEDDKPENCLQAGDTQTVITDGTLIHIGGGTVNGLEYGAYYIDMISEGFTIEEEGSPSYSGNGVFMRMVFISPNPLKLAAGEYEMINYSAENEKLSYGYYNLSTDGSTNGYWCDLSEGRAVIEISGDTYFVTYQGKDEWGTPISLSYTGKLRFYDKTPQ